VPDPLPHVAKSSEEEELIKVSVLYPNTAGCKFDMNYYLNQHNVVGIGTSPAARGFLNGNSPETAALYERSRDLKGLLTRIAPVFHKRALWIRLHQG
jgi:hypothetical protein